MINCMYTLFSFSLGTVLLIHSLRSSNLVQVMFCLKLYFMRFAWRQLPWIAGKTLCLAGKTAELLSASHALTFRSVGECFRRFSFQTSGARWSMDLYKNENSNNKESCIFVLSSHLFELTPFVKTDSIFSKASKGVCVCVCLCVWIYVWSENGFDVKKINLMKEISDMSRS